MLVNTVENLYLNDKNPQSDVWAAAVWRASRTNDKAWLEKSAALDVSTGH